MTDFFRVQLGVVSRSEGHSAAKRSAYQSCGRIVDHEGKTFDFSRKAAEHVETVLLVPQDAPDWARQPESLWRRAASIEKRVDAQEARVMDFSMPRAVSAELWEACVRHVYKPFIDMGMAMQIDIHDSTASDGGRNINVHGLATLREFNGDGFASRKKRAWNDHFRERNGRVVRELFAERLTSFCAQHGIDYHGDARPNAERHLPDPEPELPRWNFEYAGRTGEMPEALSALHDHRRCHREWEAAQAEEIEAALEIVHLEIRFRTQHQYQIFPADAGQRLSSKSDRRAAILRTWHQGEWIDASTIPSIASVRFDEKRCLLWINLADGTTLIDRSDVITMRGPVTWAAAMESAAAAERHGWESVQVHGDQTYKDAIAVACMLRGIEVTNHALSPKAKAAFEGIASQQPKNSENLSKPGRSSSASLGLPSKPSRTAPKRLLSSREVHLMLSRRSSLLNPTSVKLSDEERLAPVLKPRTSKF